MTKTKRRKRKCEGIHYLFRPGDLQKRINSFGYHFPMGRYVALIIAALAGAIGCGFLFSLHWALTALVAAACILSLPGMILDGYRQMYEHKRFLDVSDYMEQMLYSFQREQKIVSALMDTMTLFSQGRMRQAIEKAIAYIEQGSYQSDLYREALGIIESEYPGSRLSSVHEYLCTVERNGGSCGDGIDLLLQDKAVWADNVLLLQEDKRAARTRVVLSIAVTLALALVFHSVYRSMPPQYSIVGNPIVQVGTTLLLLADIWIFKRAEKEIAKSWLTREDAGEEEKMARYYEMVTSYDPKKERKKSIAFGGAFFLFAAMLQLLGHSLAALAAAGAGVFFLNQHRLGYRLAYDKVVKEINRVFPSWLMEMALLLQGNNVQVSIEKTVEHAPAIMKGELQKLSDSLKRKPDALEPYLDFFGMFQLSSVQSSMKMLYAISESGSGDAQAQIRILVQRNSKMLDKSEKASNEKSLAGISGIFYLPQITVSLQTMANMVVFMLVFLGQLKLP